MHILCICMKFAEYCLIRISLCNGIFCIYVTNLRFQNRWRYRTPARAHACSRGVTPSFSLYRFVIYRTSGAEYICPLSSRTARRTNAGPAQAVTICRWCGNCSDSDTGKYCPMIASVAAVAGEGAGDQTLSGDHSRDVLSKLAMA